MGTQKRTVLVAGAQGVIGRAAAQYFSKDAGTTVFGISRRPIDGLENVRQISADLLNPEDTCRKLGGLKDVTHVVFGAYAEKDTPTERSAVNAALPPKLIEAGAAAAPD